MVISVTDEIAQTDDARAFLRSSIQQNSFQCWKIGVDVCKDCVAHGKVNLSRAAFQTHTQKFLRCDGEFHLLGLRQKFHA